MRRILVSLAVLTVVLGAAPASGQEGDPNTHHVVNEVQYRAALAAAATGPVTVILDANITLDDGTDPGFSRNQPLTIDGNGFTVSGNDDSRVLISTGFPIGPLTLTDILIRDGSASGDGGAVHWNNSVTITGSSLTDNHVAGSGLQSGGAVFASGTITVTDSVVKANSAISSTTNASGGGLYAEGTGSDIVATRTEFRTNRAETTAAGASASGGAAFAIDRVTLTDGLVDGNRAVGGFTSGGGGLRGDTVTILRSTLSDNHSLANTGANGGAAYAFTDVTATESVFVDNEAGANLSGSNAGGGAIESTGTVHLVDTTVTDTVTNGIARGRGAVRGITVDLRSSTVAHNGGATVSDVAATTLTGAGAVVGDSGPGASCGQREAPIGSLTSTLSDSVGDDGSCMPAGGGNQAAVDDLLLGLTRDNGGTTRSLFPLAGSPVIDVVSPCTDGRDQRRVVRPFGDACDAGAVEAVYPPHDFTDVPRWVEDAVRWLASDVNQPPLMVGMTPTTFRARDPIKRSQVVRLLYRLMGEPDPTAYGPHPFTDVPRWVEDAVRWAYGEEIVTGETPTLFRPDDPITRGQVVRMVYRVAGSPPVAGIDPPPFDDVPAWVADAIRWAANPDNPLPLVTGETPTQFNAEEDITRGQVARMVWRLAITPEAWLDPSSAPSTVPFRPSA